jgi:hypothetical protein
MLRNYYINKEWIVSAVARYVYRLAAIMSVALFFGWFVALWVGGIPPALAPLARLFLLIGVLGAAVTITGMEYFLFGFDRSSAWKKTFWFCVMMFPLLGPAMYCFFVYLRSEVHKASVAKRVDGALA